jgi:5S rRNA maturation endonuclease (ribonuclease M5)
MTFNQNLINQISNRLRSDNPKFKISGAYINGLKCPACGKVDGFAHADNPMAILCHRNNECGINTPVKDIYPDLWCDLTKDYPPTPSNPTATARAYLESRGLNPDLIEFKQGKIYDRDTKKEYQSLVIEQDGVKFERLIDYSGKDKNRLSKYSGKVYQNKFALMNDDEWHVYAEGLDVPSWLKGIDGKVKLFAQQKAVFIVEGIIDALSLESIGIAAIATYSSDSIPKEWYEQNADKKFILAFDNDAAGINATKKTIEFLTELGGRVVINRGIALPPRGKDWNDLLVSNIFSDDSHENTRLFDKFEWYGLLTTAKSAQDYYETYRGGYGSDNFFQSTTLIFEFNNWIYKGWTVIKRKDGEDVTEHKVKMIADCSIKLLHSVIDDTQDDKQLMEHYVEIKSNQGKGRIRLDASELTRLDSFKIALANHRQLFCGDGNDLTALASYLFKPNPPKIRALNTIGYDKKSNGFYFPKFMYDVDGRRIDANVDKYFTVANIKPFMDCADTVTSRIDDIDLKQFIQNLHGAYGNKGLMALGFYVSGLFSDLIFDHYGFFPFLSLYGDPHAGKSFVSKLLNRCLFVDSEGQTMSKANTAKGELRKISQKSSLVCALLEGRKDAARFDYDSILPLYNRHSLYDRATTSQDNRVHSLMLKAPISFVWNHECFTLKPAKERVISLHFADADLNESTGAAWTQLNNYSPEQLAGVGHYLLKNRKLFENKLIKSCQKSADILKTNGINVTRIAENHAIALAGIFTLLESLQLESSFDDALVDYTIERAKNKLETAKSESHLADYFFESIEGLKTTDGVATNSLNELVVHLSKVLAYLQQNNNGFNNKGELIAELKRHDRFVGIKTTKCFGKACDAYHFRIE